MFQVSKFSNVYVFISLFLLATLDGKKLESALQTSQSCTANFTTDNIATRSPAVAETTATQVTDTQYSTLNKIFQGIQSHFSFKFSNINIKSTITIISDLTFVVFGFDDQAHCDMVSTIRNHGGRVVTNTYSGIPHYGVVPLNGANLKETVTNVVTSHFVVSFFF